MKALIFAFALTVISVNVQANCNRYFAKQVYLDNCIRSEIRKRNAVIDEVRIGLNRQARAIEEQNRMIQEQNRLQQEAIKQQEDLMEEQTRAIEEQNDIQEAEFARQAECVNNFETPVAGSLVSNAALPRVHAAWVLEG